LFQRWYDGTIAFARSKKIESYGSASKLSYLDPIRILAKLRRLDELRTLVLLEVAIHYGDQRKTFWEAVEKVGDLIPDLVPYLRR
ncbi:hypothetical protein, partial [Escherichia coli]|uniref:hypothetical protein n=1 Tax=Escherichia coli TaxID=562 RepID=UPI001953A2D3